MRALSRFIQVSVALLAIPAIGLTVGYYVASHRLSLSLLGLGFRFDARRSGPVLQVMSIGAAGLALLMMTSLWVGAAVCRHNRNRLAILFGPLIRGSCVVLAVLALCHMAIVIISGTLLALAVFHIVPLALLLTVVAGAFYAAKEFAEAGLRMSHPAEHRVVGRLVSQTHQPILWECLSRIAAAMDARVPDHVVLGLQPSFFATAAKIRLVDSNMLLNGETLYLSVACLRLVSEAEFSTIVGHELQHFTGEDTAFSLRFLPIYQSLLKALEAAHDQHGWRAMSVFSTRAILEQGIVWFTRAERRIGRERELMADRAGARIADPITAVTALMRSALAVRLWPTHLQSVVQRINQGAPPNNISAEFAGLSLAVVHDADRTELIDELGNKHEPHPTDTHPNLQSRAAALGVDLREVAISLEQPSSSAWNLLHQPEELELGLSEEYRRRLILDGFARPPSDPARPNFVQKKRQQRRAQAEARKRRLAADPAE